MCVLWTIGDLIAATLLALALLLMGVGLAAIKLGAWLQRSRARGSK